MVSVKSRWPDMTRQVFCDVRWWLALMLLFSGYRALLLGWFHAGLDADWTARVSGSGWRLGLALLLLACGVAGARGSWGRRPVQQKDAAVTGSALLNALTPNYWLALKFALTDGWRRANPDQLPPWLRDSGIRRALVILHGERARSAPSLDDLLKSSARGHPSGAKPRHIFLVVMESGDLWPMLPPYDALGLMPETRGLAERGVFFPRFISAGAGTMPSLAAIISGLPDTGVAQNYQPLSRRPFPTALALTFKRLGYRTRLFYGGFLSWQRLGAFATEQGFDETHGGGEMVKNLGDMGEWGVADGDLFARVTESLGAAPTFNLIMMTSYHPPYSLPVERLGCAIEAVPPALAAVYDGGTPLRVFAHLRYADRELGRFVAEVERAFPDSLFAITGDHWSRRFLNEHPTLYESRAVPLVLYGPLALGVSGGRDTPGSHLDIAPTLAGLVAERGFEYYSFGRDLLSDSGGVARPFATGRNEIITATEIFPLSLIADDDPAQAWCRAWLGAAWWRLMRGAQLPSDSAGE